MVLSETMNLECPKLWHYDDEYGSCRPGIEHVDLQCSGDLIEVNFNNIIFNNENNITVNRYDLFLYTITGHIFGP